MDACSVIGYGRFGRLTASLLAKKFRIIVHDPKKGQNYPAGIRPVSMSGSADAGIIILAVPVNRLEDVLRKLAPRIRPGTLVVDVCSVKEYTVRLMKSVLPSGTEIVGTHPLFGPDSFRDPASAKTVVLTPVTVSKARLSCIRRFLKENGIGTVIISPAEHDRLMARTLFVTQFIGRSCNPILMKDTPVATVNYRLLQRISNASVNDSQELLSDFYRYNRFSHRVPDRLIREMQKLRNRLGC